MNAIEVAYCVGLFLLNVGLCAVHVKAKCYHLSVVHAFLAAFCLVLFPLILEGC